MNHTTREYVSPQRRIEELEEVVRRCKASLKWAAGFLRCQCPRHADYADYHELAALAEDGETHGPFQVALVRAELAEHERDEARAEAERLRALLRRTRRFVGSAYAVACDAQALLAVRTDLKPVHSPVTELAELERQAAAWLDALPSPDAEADGPGGPAVLAVRDRAR